MIDCTQIVAPRQRTFWTTQPAACGEVDDCGIDCGRPGLLKVRGLDCDPGDWCGDFGHLNIPCEIKEPKTILNTNWVRGLALNMLLTDARRANKTCGYRPGAASGHWSQSFITGRSREIGTSLRDIKPQGSIVDTTAQVKFAMTKTLNKLVEYNVARKVDVTVSYIGRGVISAVADIILLTGETSNVALSGTRSGQNWNWQ